MPRSDPSLTQNPVREARKKLGYTLHEFAGVVGVNYQAIYLNECGVYQDVLPAVVSYLKRKGYKENELQKDYQEFIRLRRQNFLREYGPFKLVDVDSTESFMTTWRHSLGLSKMALSKLLCIQPTLVDRVETGKARKLPNQIRDAFHDLGFTFEELEEIDYRLEEFHFSPYRFQD